MRTGLLIITQLSLLLGSASLAHAQNVSAIPVDSIMERPGFIELSEIPSKSVELRIRIKAEINGIISDDAIKKIETKNNAVIASIVTQLNENINPSDVSINIRYLENRLAELSQGKRKINELKNEQTAIISIVDNLKNGLSKESSLWKNSISELVIDSLTPIIPAKLNETIVFLDSTMGVLGKRRNLLLEILDRNILTSIELDKETEKSKSLIMQRQSQALKSDHPPFFRLNFRTGYAKELRASFLIMKRAENAEFVKYFRERSDIFIFLLILICGLVYLFSRINSRINFQKDGYGYFYKGMFEKFLSHPVSAAIILTFFFSLFVLRNRPVVLRELSFYFIAFPMLHLMSVMINKRYHVYIYSFGIIILFYMILLFFSNESVLYRILLLFISLAEISLLTLFLLRSDRGYELKQVQKVMVYSFVFLHLALAVTGFVSNLSGRIILTEIVLSAVFFNIFYGLALFISAILINGLIVTSIDSSKWQRLNLVRIHSDVIKRRLTRTMYLLAVFFWVILVLRNFRIVDYIYDKLILFLTSEIELGSARFSLDLILIFFIIIYFSIILANLIRALLEEEILVRFSLSKGVPHSIAMMVKYIFVTGGFFLAVNAAGISLDKLTIVLGAMSVGIGFGLQNIFSNLVSGLILLYERPIQLGDTVQVGDLTGSVKFIGLRSSNIVTFDGAEVIVPNGQLVSNEVINWTLSDKKRRSELRVCVAYNSDTKLVLQLLNSILVKQYRIIQDPVSSVFLSKLGESSIEFTMIFWLGDYTHDRTIKSEILLTVLEEFEKHKIKIPYHQQDVHIVTAGKSVPGDSMLHRTDKLS